MEKALKIVATSPYPLGLHWEGKSVRVSFLSAKENCSLLLYQEGIQEEPVEIPFPKEFRIGNIHCMKIENWETKYTAYQFLEEGTKVADPYGQHFQAHPYNNSLSDSLLLSSVLKEKYTWGKEEYAKTSLEDSVFYCLHVRGFTMDSSSGVKHKGTYKGVMEKLPYIKQLGVTSLLFMPMYEYIEREIKKQEVHQKYGQIMLEENQADCNYWGYKKGYYYAPKGNFAATNNAVVEMKDMIKACHQKGIEVWMQFYFPGEMYEREIVSILEFWAMEYHIDGFQIKTDHINMKSIVNSPLLCHTKFMYQHFEDADFSKLGRQNQKRFAVFEESTLPALRRFLKGDEYSLEGMMYHVRKNGNEIAHINYIADYNTFRIRDMVTYDYKRNEDNGERNRDGSSFNHSWNCGEEGESKSRKIKKLRLKQIKNALCLVFLGQATPYLYMGDECGKTQTGNNNPYNQDTETSWMSWKLNAENKEILNTTKQLINFRKEHPILRMREYLNGYDLLSCGMPNISFHGVEAFKPQVEPYRRELGILLCGNYAVDRDGVNDKTIYLLYNMHWEDHVFALPRLNKGQVWSLAFGTEELQKTQEELLTKEIVIPSRTILVLIAQEK